MKYKKKTLRTMNVLLRRLKMIVTTKLQRQTWLPAEPKKGMIFYTIGDAFTLYKRYAKRKGFSTDKKNLLN